MNNINQYPTYMAASTAFTPGNQDAFTITGNATTNVYILKMGFSTAQTTAGINYWALLKRSAANTAGTPASVVAVPVQSGSAAAGAVVRQYTANPTAGTSLGPLWVGWVNSPAPATAGIGGLEGVEIDFETMLGQPIALLSASEVLALNFGGNSVPSGMSVLAWVLWMETKKVP